MNHIALFLLGEMRLSAKKGHEDRTWRVTTVIDTTENHTGHFDSVVRAWPPWLPFTLVDAVVALQAPQGQDPSPSASGSAGGWWPSADSISGNVILASLKLPPVWLPHWSLSHSRRPTLPLLLHDCVLKGKIRDWIQKLNKYLVDILSVHLNYNIKV